MIYTIINYLSYTPIFIFILILVLSIKKRQCLFKYKYYLLATVISILMMIILIYARIIEPNNIRIESTDIEAGFKGKIVLISDLHVGAYIKQDFIVKVVSKINEIDNVDAVVIAGDITYYPQENLNTLLSPLSQLKYPTLAVLGNHDTGHPGPEIEEELTKTLVEQGVIVLDNSSAKIEDTDIIFHGLGELWDENADINSIEGYVPEDNLIVIAHNPDTVYEYENSIPDLTISGHTHGGQIRIPFVYKYFIPTEYSFDKGLYSTEKGQVFVTAGIGTSGLPFRLGVPPTIDILNLY